jgi:excinuclease UvrABC nuclease subunit
VSSWHKQLTLHFGSVAKMRQATQSELAQAPGMNDNLAEVLYDYLHDATKN